MDQSPEISVVTVVYNRAKTLPECLDSVHAQQGVHHEHVVVDGGSTDGTLDHIRQRQHRLAWWCSEPDRGIADAMNKGLARARGRWLLFLHSDDHLMDSDSLARCAQILRSSDADMVGFPIQYGTPERFRILRPRGGGWWLNLKSGLLHQATFMRRDLFERLGGYDPDLRIAMDYEFFLRARRAGARFVTSSAVIPTFMREGGLGSRIDPEALRERFAEERKIHLRHAGSRMQKKAYALYWALYPRYRGSR